MPIKKPQKDKRMPVGFKHHVAALKLKMITATELSDILAYFFDHLGENNAFFDLGKRKNNAKLAQILNLSARQVIKDGELRVANMLMISIPEFKFVHGSALFNQYLATYFYFEDIDVGLLALALFPPNRRTEIIRFSCQILGQPPTVIAN